MNKEQGAQLRPGHVVQINAELTDCFFPGCFMLVTEVKSWGVQGFIAMPQTRDEAPGHAYFRATWKDIEFVGPATWVTHNVEEKEDETAP